MVGKLAERAGKLANPESFTERCKDLWSVEICEKRSYNRQ